MDGLSRYFYSVKYQGRVRARVKKCCEIANYARDCVECAFNEHGFVFFKDESTTQRRPLVVTGKIKSPICKKGKKNRSLIESGS